MLRLLGLLVSTVATLCLVAFVAAYLAYYVPPEAVWWLQVLALGLPGIVVALVPLALLAFLAGRTWLGGALVLALFLFGLRHLSFGGASDHATDMPNGEMTVLTYNSKAGNTFRSMNLTIAELVRESDPDVACLQEYLVIPSRLAREPVGSLSRTIALMGYQTASGVSRGLFESRLPILTRLPIVEEEILPLTRLTNSYAVRAVLEGPNGPFAVYNLHLRGFTDDRPWRQGNVLDPRDWVDFFQKSRGSYLVRASEVRALKQHVQAEEYPFVVCGDLNTTSSQWDYRHLARGLQDAFEVAGDGWGKTYHARVPIVRIDYILASEAWTIGSAEVLAARSGSDHKPVAAKIRLR